MALAKDSGAGLFRLGQTTCLEWLVSVCDEQRMQAFSLRRPSVSSWASGGDMDSGIEDKRRALLTVYKTESWRNKVMLMPDNQVVAVYLRLKREQKL